MLGHLLGLLLAHCAAQQICATERVCADDLRGLHHLFLIHHDAERFFEHGLQALVVILSCLGAVLACDVIWNQIHRAWAIQRVKRGQIFKSRRLGLHEQVFHAGRFKLKDCDRIRFTENLVNRRVIQRQRLQIDFKRRIKTLTEANRPV